MPDSPTTSRAAAPLAAQPVRGACSDPSGQRRFTSSRLLARNAALSLAAGGWVFLVLVFAMPRLVHSLGETSFGLFLLAWVVVGYLACLDIGVGRAAIKFVSEYLSAGDQESALRVVRTAVAANLAMGLAGGLAVALLSGFLVHSVFNISHEMEGQARLVFLAVAIAVPVLLVQAAFRGVLMSLQRFDWISAVDGCTLTAQWAVAAALAWKGYSVTWVVFSTVVARMVTAGVYGYLLFRLLPGLSLLRKPDLDGLIHLLRFGSWVTVSQLVNPLLTYLDRVLIASFASLGAVTLYSVPFEAMTRLRILPTSLVGTLYPAFSERGGRDPGPELRRLYERAVRYLLLLIVPGILYLFVLGPDLFTIWMGPRFAMQTAAVIRILTLGVFANALAPIPYNLLQALGRPDLTGKFHLLELPLHVALCVFLIPRFGITGAALATAVRLTLDAGLLFWAAGRYCGCSLRGVWAKVFPRVLTLGISLGIALFTIALTVKTPSARLALGLLALGVCLPAAWIFVVEREEKPRISGVVRTLLRQPAA